MCCCSVALDMRLEWEGVYSSQQGQGHPVSDSSRLEGYLHTGGPWGCLSKCSYVLGAGRCPGSVTTSGGKSTMVPLGPSLVRGKFSVSPSGQLAIPHMSLGHRKH